MRERKMRTQVREIETTVREDAPLSRKASGELLDELVSMEVEILRRYRAHQAATTPASPARDRILRALRKLDG